MTRIEILDQKVLELNEKLTIANTEVKRLEKARVFKIEELITSYFNEVLEEGDELEVSKTTVYFRRPQEGSSYNKEILSLYFREYSFKNEDVKEIQTSFYSTTDNSEFELRRMVLLGKVGQVLLDFKDDILAGYNQIISESYDEHMQAHEVRWGIDSEIRDINKEISKIKKENLISKLEKEGIEITLPEGTEYRKYPTLEIGYNNSIYYIKGLKILSKTASGKSANIEVAKIENVWDGEGYVKQEVKREYEKVRMNNILAFLENNSTRISAS